MPMHDWTKVDAGTYHDFHQSWSVMLRAELNNGTLPEGYFAQVERRAQGKEPDVLTYVETGVQRAGRDNEGGLATMTKFPIAQAFYRADEDIYAARANRIVVNTDEGEVVAVIEIVSPGNKSDRRRFKAFRKKVVQFIERGTHVLIVDPFPPGPGDPQGVHAAIWKSFGKEPVPFDDAKPLTNASYFAGMEICASVHSIAVGDELPALPLFLGTDEYVNAPLEQSYLAAWKSTGRVIRQMLSTSDP